MLDSVTASGTTPVGTRAGDGDAYALSVVPGCAEIDDGGEYAGDSSLGSGTSEGARLLRSPGLLCVRTYVRASSNSIVRTYVCTCVRSRRRRLRCRRRCLRSRRTCVRSITLDLSM